MHARILAVVLASVACGGACRREGPSGTTTVRSGTPGGQRVTDITQDDPDTRLTTELCRHAEACGQVGHREARWPTLGACLADLEGGPRRLDPSCAEPRRAALDACLAAIRGAACDTPLDGRSPPLPECRAEVLCAGPSPEL